MTADAAGTEAEKAATADVARPNQRKERTGVVVSAKPDKTVVVAVTELVRHRRYQKILRRTRKFHAHDESNEVNEGDTVRIREIRPMSKLKRWRVTEILERAR